MALRQGAGVSVREVWVCLPTGCRPSPVNMKPSRARAPSILLQAANAAISRPVPSQQSPASRPPGPGHGLAAPPELLLWARPHLLPDSLCSPRGPSALSSSSHAASAGKLSLATETSPRAPSAPLLQLSWPTLSLSYPSSAPWRGFCVQTLAQQEPCQGMAPG